MSLKICHAMKPGQRLVLSTLLSCCVIFNECTVDEEWNSMMKRTKAVVVGILGRISLGRPKTQKANWWWNEEVQATEEGILKAVMQPFGQKTEMPSGSYDGKQRITRYPSPITTRALRKAIYSWKGEVLIPSIEVRHRATTYDTRHLSTI